VQAQADALANTLPCDQGNAVTSQKVLLGYSMGARAALQHAIAHPTVWDALILISANAGIEDELVRSNRAASDNALAQRIMRDGIPAFLDQWQQTPIIRSQQQINPTWQASMRHHRLQHTPAGLAASLKQFGQATCPNLWPLLHQLHCPILLISGEQDSKYGTIAQRMLQILPTAQWVSIPKAGHMPHLESPQATAAIIHTFLNQS
jgi:2-succinyl-6-hydroxy-2,4-cyclohexadiene-1-carboxylate synthase